MTNYWPMSVIRNSSLLPPEFAWEVSRMHATNYLSLRAFQACIEVAREIRPVETGLVIIESINAPTRRVYGDHPETDEWLRLERSGIIEGDDGTMYVIIDGLH